jgi:ATP-dependent exoDNAse (exonuclease V) beta subunit
MKTAIHPSGITLLFDDTIHQYKVGGEVLTSVTTLIKQNFPEFDSVKIAKRKAKKDGVTEQSLLDLWQKIGDEASAFGNLVHLMAETIVRSKSFAAADDLAQTDKAKLYLEAVKASIAQILRNYEIIEPEQIVFSMKYKVAGTMDLLLRHRKTGKYLIADYKTSKEIKTSSYQGQRGYGPCARLENCNFIHYSLQLEIYKRILIEEGFVPSTSDVSGAIIHYVMQDGKVILRQINSLKLSDVAQALLDSMLNVQEA